MSKRLNWTKDGCDLDKDYMNQQNQLQEDLDIKLNELGELHE